MGPDRRCMDASWASLYHNKPGVVREEEEAAVAVMVCACMCACGIAICVPLRPAACGGGRMDGWMP